MRRFRSYLIGLQQGSRSMFSDFDTGGAMWTGTGAREVRAPIAFDEPFRTAPVILAGLAMFDMDNGSNPRADLSHEEVTPAGFVLVFRTWGDTRIARVRADWTAIGEVCDPDDWDV